MSYQTEVITTVNAGICASLILMPRNHYDIFLNILKNCHLFFREQLAIADFAKSLLVIPKTLAVNAAQDSSDLVAKLRAYHNTSQTKADHASLKNNGLDLYEGAVRDNLKAGVFEPAISKVRASFFGTHFTVLR